MASFNSVQSVAHASDAASIAEIQCAILGEFRLAEMPFDREPLCDSFIASVSENSTDWDSPEYYEQEPEACYQHAQLMAADLMAAEIERNAALLAEHYPFDVSDLSQGVIKLREHQTSVGRAYLWLKVYLLRLSPNDYIQFDRKNDDRKNSEYHQFDKKFESVFEHLAGFAVSGQFGPALWLSGRSRSAEAYMAVLQDICDTIEHGTLKAFDDLPENNKKTNDGRADGICITRPEGAFSTNSQLYLVQATYQKTKLQDKTVTNVNVTFFNDFFNQQVKYAKQGILVVPHEFSPLLEDECRTANCVYFHLETLLQNLGKTDLSFKLLEHTAPFEEHYAKLEDHVELQAF
ncbi:MAG: hypothetical protein ABJN35_14440 [Erythrobacter sp.]